MARTLPDLGPVRLPLLQAPMAMDTQQGHLLLAFAPLQLLQVRVDVHGRIRPSHTPKATLTTVRELNLLSLPRPIIAAALIANRFSAAGSSGNLPEIPSMDRWGSLQRQSTRLTGEPTSPHDTHGTFWVSRDGAEQSSSTQVGLDSEAAAGQRGGFDPWLDDWRAAAPSHCLVLRWGGLLTLIDLDTGVETLLFEVCIPPAARQPTRGCWRRCLRSAAPAARVPMPRLAPSRIRRPYLPVGHSQGGVGSASHL